MQLSYVRLDSASQAGSGTFPTFVSVTLVDSLGALTLAIVMIGVVLRYFQWKKKSPPGLFGGLFGRLGLGKTAFVFLSELVNRVVLQREVINDRLRRFTHLCMFWGFMGLSLTTTLDYVYNQPGNYTPIVGAELSPIRWLGNVSGVVMLIGATITIVRLGAVRRFRTGRSFWDVWFAVLLFLVGISGFVAEYLGDLAYAANPSVLPAAPFGLSLSADPLIVIPYGIHLVSIGLLFVTAPVSAFMHALTVPSLRFIDTLGSAVSHQNRSQVDEVRRLKEAAIIQQVKALSEEVSKES